MIKKIIKLIYTLKIFLLSIIIVWFLFVLGLNPVGITKFVGSKIGSAIGISVGVQENSYNKLALQLQEKEEELAEKEENLDRIESEIVAKNNLFQNRLLLIVVFGITILFVLILLNYYFDHKRRKANLNK